MRIIGIDLSYAKEIKVAVLSSRGRLITLGSIPVDESLFEMAKRVHKFILPFGACLVVMEAPIPINNRTTFANLLRIATMIDVLLHESGFSVRQIRPQAWQKFVLGDIKGNKKEASIVEATKRFGSSFPRPINNDEADALNIAVFAVKHSTQLLKGEF